jgi:hypothetical protein
MSSITDRNRQLLIQRIQGDPRLDGAKVHGAAALMRVSITVTVLMGVVGAIVAQVLFGEGGIQFGVGMAAGYAGYFGYLALRMEEPRVIGAMAAVTDRRVVLLGSRKKGVVAEWKLEELDNLEMIRRGNLFIMGKLQITPAGGDPITFLTTNRRLALSFVETYEAIRSGEIR